MAPRLKEAYRETVIPELMKEIDCGNIMQVPKIEKVVVNMGTGEAAHDSKILDGAMRDLSTITGQRPYVRRAKKSIAGFKLREGMSVGCAVTLRGNMMYEFIDRLISVAIPRIRDFKGLNPKSFDGKGNFTMGVDEQLIFPEIDYDSIDRIRGMNITIVTTANNNEDALALLKGLGLPFKSK